MGEVPPGDLKVRRQTTAAELGALQTTDGNGGTTSAESGTVTTASAITKNLAVILINFKDNTTQPFSKSTVQTAMTGSSTSVKRYVEEDSKGRWALNATVYGWYTINATSTSCDWSNWTTLGGNAATAAGVNLSAFTNQMYIIPDTSACGWAGVSGWGASSHEARARRSRANHGRRIYAPLVAPRCARPA